MTATARVDDYRGIYFREVKPYEEMVDKWVHCEGAEEVEFSRYSIVETAVYSSDWERKAVGTALWSVSDVSQYPYVKASILGASDKAYYYYYAAAPSDPPPPELQDADKCEDFFLHFCTSTECDDSWIEHDVDKEEYVHCYAWRVVSNATAKKKLKEWGITPPHSSWFDKAYQANYRHRASYNKVEDKLSDVCPLGDIQAVIDKSSTALVPMAKKKGGKKSDGKVVPKASEAVGSAKKRKKRQEVSTESATKGGRSREEPPPAVLDAELERLRSAVAGRAERAGLDADASPGPSILKKRHKGTGSLNKPSTERPLAEAPGAAEEEGPEEAPSPKKKAADVLAERASQHAEKRGAKAAASEEKELTGVDVLGKLLRKVAGVDSEDLDDSLDSSEQKRMAYRKLAQSNPGVLLQRLLRLMREQVCSLSGEGEDEDALAPVAMRFYLAVFLPNHRELGEPELREIRTLCEALDGLLRGRTLETADLLAMRLKAAMLAAQEGMWQVARHLELLPPMQKHLPLNQEEETLIRRVEAGDLKLRDLVQKIKKGKSD